MIVRLLTEHHLESLSLIGAAEAHPSLHMSKCHIVGNLMHWLTGNSLTVGFLLLWYSVVCTVESISFI